MSKDNLSDWRESHDETGIMMNGNESPKEKDVCNYCGETIPNNELPQAMEYKHFGLVGICCQNAKDFKKKFINKIKKEIQ